MPLRFADDTAIFTNAVPNWGITASQSSSFDFNSSRSAAITSSRRRTSSLSRSDSLTIVPRSAVRRALALDKASIVFWSSADRFRLHIATTPDIPLRVTSTAGNLARSQTVPLRALAPALQPPRCLSSQRAASCREHEDDHSRGDDCDGDPEIGVRRTRCMLIGFSLGMHQLPHVGDATPPPTRCRGRHVPTTASTLRRGCGVVVCTA
jgi:hypothetical protein